MRNRAAGSVLAIVLSAAAPSIAQPAVPAPTPQASATGLSEPAAVASDVPVATEGPAEAPVEPRKEIVIGLGVGAGIALIAGGIFAGVSAAKGGEVDRIETRLITEDGLQRGACAVENKPAGCEALLSAVYEQNAFATASMWSFIGAGVLGAVTLGYWYFAPRKDIPEARMVRLGGAVGGTGGRIVLEGSW